jgi:tRNA (adenine-N(1)-)-methyltransferase non-catalytic subunit
MSWILVSDGSGCQMALNLKKDKKIRWKKNFTLSIPDIKEADLPAYYRLDDRKCLVKVTEDLLEDELRNLDWGTELDASKTNADIQQSMNPQMLNNEQIVEMKESGIKGTEIIEGLIKNNQNFDKRTEFSKEKYIKKKKLKYDLIWKIEKCSLYNVFRFMSKFNQRDLMYARITPDFSEKTPSRCSTTTATSSRTRACSSSSAPRAASWATWPAS